MKRKDKLMRRSADQVLHALKDGIRTVRYTIRAEVETPGAILPRSVAHIDLAPFVAAGAVVGTPALRAVDGLLTQVETIATGVMKPQGAAAYPIAVDALFEEDTAFAALFYEPYKRLLTTHGARNTLLSEQAFDAAQVQFRVRYGDTGRRQPARASAGVAIALAEARPVRKLDLAHAAGSGGPFILDPNLYCAVAVGLMTALATQSPSVVDDLAAAQDSVDSVVDARFDRFKRALASKSPASDLAAQFEAVLPFLP